MSYMNFDSLPDPSSKFQLENVIASGCTAKVYRAKDLESGKYFAIKVQPYDDEHQVQIEEEYRTLRDYASYPNIVDFYGVYRNKKSGGHDEIWFVTEYCEYGPVVDLVNRLLKRDRRMKEEHIAYILREAAKAVLELNRNHFIHRDVRGNNILITKNGEIKLCDFGLTREVDSTFGKRGTCIGSPCWMSPELVTAQEARSNEVYDSRSDVWALGITAIEMGDGRPPFADMHPTRAMFQIVRNPPPTLLKISNWSQNYCDFIAECLEKNPENRPFLMEIIEHPFLVELPENEYAIQTEIKHLCESVASETIERKEEILVDQGFTKRLDQPPEKMLTEDLAAVENPSDEKIVDLLGQQIKRGTSYTFIGDILLAMNTNDIPEHFQEQFHEKYKFKSRSENAPHIFAAADVAYQDMMHHKEPQHIVFSGESYSGKSTNARLFVEHLFYLGAGNRGATERVEKTMKAIAMLINAGTPLNPNSTRCVLQSIITFGTTGKCSGGVFLMNLLEKMRVSTTDMDQHNFHIFYYFYDYMDANGQLADYSLDSGRKYRYLRIPAEKQATKLKYVRDTPEQNAQKFKEFEDILVDLDISRKCLETIRKILGAILNLGDVRFKKNDKRAAELEDPDTITKVSDLLRVDEKKFVWSLLNYCKVKGGIAERKHYSPEEARDSRDSLAATIYNRLVDWIFNKINLNLAFPRAVFGDKNSIHIHDMFGFECFPRNTIEQLMVNTLNEQMQYHYNQMIFANAAYEQEIDDVPPVAVNYYNNKAVLDQLLTKPEGLFSLIDDASKALQDYEAILDKVKEKRSSHIKQIGTHEISVTHYTGKITYDARNFPDTNRDFVPPEMIESLRSSLDEIVCLMFTNNLSKSGNLTMAANEGEGSSANDQKDDKKTYNLNTLSKGQFSQVNQMRSLATLFRTCCLEMLKMLAFRTGNVGCHFIRCIRADLEYQPRNIHRDMVMQQIKALAVMDTIISRQQGYSCRITFQEFLNRYQFLAFDFDETVDVTKDNCRLLLVRLKMEGWAIGKSKVFLRYYNDEYLSRLYETQVKKIIKVQAMMRSYLLRKRKGKQVEAKPKLTRTMTTPDEAALAIQKAYRGYKVRQNYGPLLNEKTGQIDTQTAQFLKQYAKRWRSRSLFQVLLHYRAARFQDLVNMSQQVHVYNQRFVCGVQITARSVPSERINSRETNPSAFGSMPLPVRKLPFKLNEIPSYDTSFMCDIVSPVTNFGMTKDEDQEVWDGPLQPPPSLTQYLMTYNAHKKEQSCQTNWERRDEVDVVYQQHYSRDPHQFRRSNNFSDNSRLNAPNNRSYGAADNSSRSSYPPNDSYRRFGAASPAYGTDSRRPSAASHDFGSNRRSSLKKHAAPNPPAMKGTRNDNSWMRNNNRPANPVHEMELMARRNADNNTDGDEPPFNFKAMLRKTNYATKDDINNVYNSGANTTKAAISVSRSENNFTHKRQDSKSEKRSVSAANLNEGDYVEEEIAPGVTLQGNAYII